MRLYLNSNEVHVLKNALNEYGTDHPITHDSFAIIQRLLDRIEICEELQRSEAKSKPTIMD